MNDTAHGPERLRSIAQPTASPGRRAILVLGMHRSGTSALAGAVNALGAAVPKTLPKPDRWNPRGYFECARLFVLLDEMLASAGSSWDDWRQLDQNWFHSETAGLHRQKIKELLIEEFGDESLIVIKDGRICRFVPFISSILATLSFDTVAVLPLRNPLEVALSLRERDKFGLPKALLLWLRHVLEAEFHSRQMPRCFVAYEEFVLDWRSHLHRIAENTGLTWPDSSKLSEAKIDEFLTTDLRRKWASTRQMGEHPEVIGSVRDVFGILMSIAGNGESAASLEQLDRERARFDQACDALRASAPTDPSAEAQMGLLRNASSSSQIADACRVESR
jgi:hypothetical protein